MRLVGIGFSALALVGLIACSKVPDTVKIGVAQPLSGPLAALGKDMLEGVQLAVKEINASGVAVDGKTVRFQIVAVDDQSSPGVGAQVARHLVDEGVVAVIGHLNSGVSIEAAPIYAARNIPQLAISTQPKYTQLGFPTTLRLVASDAIQGRAMGTYAATTLSESACAVVDDSTSYGKALADLAEKSLNAHGRTVALRRSFDDKTTEFGALVKELKTRSVETIVTTLADFQVVALVQQLADAQLTNIKIVGGDTLKTNKLLAQKLPLEVFATSPVLEPREFYRGAKFVEAFNTAYGHAPVYGSHYAYDAMYLLSNAVHRANSVDGKVLTTKLRQLDYMAPVTNVMKFGPDGEQLYGSVGVYRPRGGRWEPLMSSDRW
ncbi:Leucine-, isoleucine-, valine-, threonine-, and alanine-binding protein precursor [Variovorax sp. PBS-H4]|uniref:branched-chain amino acid ABC transporter substrate-binding protein n=1 Tax=Variovorax sp. PBS-H4 TaxID=434008 RepID=UPI001315E0AF|nr:branched-chain amino acid ABC transporter substrate-binding protein [Variovorax sp. PBS-H4]VTU38646.1 Leucine-, isoleucine-, valine-, threonine-, and alanine-binding protein precursor [Variovorax sp. PBS-H4]